MVHLATLINKEPGESAPDLDPPRPGTTSILGDLEAPESWLRQRPQGNPAATTLIVRRMDNHWDAHRRD